MLFDDELLKRAIDEADRIVEECAEHNVPPAVHLAVLAAGGTIDDTRALLAAAAEVPRRVEGRDGRRRPGHSGRPGVPPDLFAAVLFSLLADSPFDDDLDPASVQPAGVQS